MTITFNSLVIKASRAVKVSESLRRPYLKMSGTLINDPWLEKAKKIVPPLLPSMHKGEAGRIGIIGGSSEYTGAPYYAGIAALKFGCDLVHIFCPQSASLPIKCYSPELIVHPLLDSENSLELIKPWLPRLHVLVIGNGLGRDENILQLVTKLILLCKETHKPLVVDADGLFLLSKNLSIFNGYKNVILTPNAMELHNLIKDSDDRRISETNEKLQALKQKLGDTVIVMEKALNDHIYDTSNLTVVQCPSGGSNRRCGGQGDLLAGAIATFYHWGLNFKNPESEINDNPAVLACYAASFLIKRCNVLAFEKYGRSLTAEDMIGFIGKCINEF